LAALLAAVAVHRGDADERGDLLTVELTQLGQLGEAPGGIHHGSATAR